MAKSQHIQSVSNLILAMQDKEEGMKRVANRRTTQQLKAQLYQKSREPAEPESQPWGNPMKRVRVKSNFARDRVVMLGNGQLVLRFDAQGFATMPEHQLHLLNAEMRSRPGRYQVLSDALKPKKQAAKDQAPASEMAPELKEQVKELLGSLKAAEESAPEPEEAKAEEPEKDPEAEPRRPKRRSRKKKKESTEEE